MASLANILLGGTLRAFIDAVRRFNDQGGFVRSSHVAMSMMLALFPFILFVVAMAGALSRDVDRAKLIEFFFGVWPDEIATPIVSEIQAVLAADSVQLMTIGGVLALYFASNGVDAVRVALSYAYRDVDPRPFWKTRLLCVAFVLVGGALALFAVTVGFGIPAYFRFVAQAIPDVLVTWAHSPVMQSAVTLGILTIAVAACHLWLPGTPHGLRQTWPGVLLTVVMWVAAVWVFSIYVSYFADYSATYAGLAGAMAALIFLYLMAAILIFGAEFNAALIGRKPADVDA